jgi:hypothetical protein
LSFRLFNSEQIGRNPDVRFVHCDLDPIRWMV